MDIKQMAAAFAHMTNAQQAQFFEEAAKVVQTWESVTGRDRNGFVVDCLPRLWPDPLKEQMQSAYLVANEEGKCFMRAIRDAVTEETL